MRQFKHISKLKKLKAEIEKAIELAETSPVACVNHLWKLTQSLGDVPDDLDRALKAYQKMSHDLAKANTEKDSLHDKLQTVLVRENKLGGRVTELKKVQGALELEKKNTRRIEELIINLMRDKKKGGEYLEEARKLAAREKTRKEQWPEVLAAVMEGTTPTNHEKFNTLVDELDLTVRGANCMANADIKYVGQLVQTSERDILTLRNCGRKILEEIKRELERRGLRLGMVVLDWKPQKEK